MRWGLLILGWVAAAARAAGPDGEVPVAPVASATFAGWSGAYCLSNRAAEAAVVPGIGRVAMFTPIGGTNLLYLAPTWIGRLPNDPEFARRWINFGGLALWPVAHAQWAALEGRGVSPARLLDGYAWGGRAWRNAAGDLVSVLTREIGPPLRVRLTRDVRLGETPPALIVRQRIERVAESDVPVTLWTVGQMLRPSRVVFPLEGDGAAASGEIRSLSFAPPPAPAFSYHARAAVYRVEVGGTHRLISDSPRGWLAAEIGRTLVILRSRSPGKGGAVAPPTLFVERDAPYAEFEIAGASQALTPGEVIEDELRMEAYPCPDGLTAAELAGRARRFVGELPEAKPVPSIR